MNSRKIFLLLCLSLPFSLFSQDEKDPIVTDRPDQTESAETLPKKYFQIESGINYELSTSGSDEISYFNYNSTLLRYGIFENFELRFQWGYSNYKVENENTAFKLELQDPEPIMVGTKIQILKGEGMKPSIAFLGHITVPTGDFFFAPGSIAPDFRFSIAHDLSERFSLGYNLGMEWDGEVPNASGLYTLALGAGIVGNLGAYFEIFGFVRERLENDHSINGGLTYLLLPHLQLDAFIGKGIINGSDVFIGAGLSLRLPD